jgi:hypothetical protein
MKKLIVFGCSFAQGYGLSDPKKSWPIQLGNMLNYEICNKSIPGISNLKILTTLLNYFKNNKFLPSDIVLILWTVSTRDLIYDPNKTKWRDILPHHNDAIVKHWAATHDDIDLQFRSWLYIQHASLFLKSHNITYYNFTSTPELLDSKPNFVELDIKYPQFLEIIDQYGSVDGVHPNELSHTALASEILNNIVDVNEMEQS